jgi:hypothetical protein
VEPTQQQAAFELRRQGATGEHSWSMSVQLQRQPNGTIVAKSEATITDYSEALRIPLTSSGTDTFLTRASAAEKAIVADATRSVEDRALVALIVLRRALAADTTADELAYRGYECLTAIGIQAQIVLATLDGIGTYPFLEITSGSTRVALDPVLVASLQLDGVPVGAEQARASLRLPGARTLAMEQPRAVDPRFRADRMLVFPPLYLDRLWRSHQEDKVLIIEPESRTRQFRQNGIALRVRAVGRSLEVEVDETISPGNITFVRSQGATVHFAEGPRHFEHLGWTRRDSLDMESFSGSDGKLANGILLPRNVPVADQGIAEGIEGRTAQRLALTDAKARLNLSITRDRRYVISGYARVHAGNPAAVIRDIPSNSPIRVPLPATGRWAAFTTPPFLAAGGNAILHIEDTGKSVTDIDAVGLYELPQPTCFEGGSYICQLSLPLREAPPEDPRAPGFLDRIKG